jgi:hypothetical protein
MVCPLIPDWRGAANFVWPRGCKSLREYKK